MSSRKKRKDLSNSNKRHVDVSIFVALGEELTTIKEVAPFSSTSSHFSSQSFTVYYFDFNDSKKRNRSGTLVFFDDTAERVKDAYHLYFQSHTSTFIVSAGISASIAKSISPGDLVLSTLVSTPLSNAKIVPPSAKDTAGMEFQFGGRTTSTAEMPTRRIKSEWDNNRAAKSELANRSRRYFAELNEKLKGQAKDLAAPYIHRANQRPPEIFCGPTVAIPAVAATEHLKLAIQKHDRKIIALDMESGYLAESVSASGAGEQFLSVRAISDAGNEEKNKFEEQTSNIFRKWAIYNLSQLLAHILQHSLELTKRAPLPPHRSTEPKMGNASKRREPFPSSYFSGDEHDLERLSRRYMSLIEQSNDGQFASNPIARVISFCLSEKASHPRMVLLRGPQSSGKRTFLDIIQNYISSRPQLGVTVYKIDIQTIKSRYYTGQLSQPLRDYFDDLLKTLIAQTPEGRKLALMIYGAQEDDESRVAAKALSQLRLEVGVTVVVAMDVVSSAYVEPVLIATWDIHATLGAAESGSDRALQLALSFEGSTRNGDSSGSSVTGILERLKKLGFRYLDPRTISVALREAGPFGNGRSPRNFVEFSLSLRNLLMSEGERLASFQEGVSTCNLVAFLTYTNAEKTVEISRDLSRVASGLCYANPDIRNSLVADFVVEALAKYPSVQADASSSESRFIRSAVHRIYDKHVSNAIKLRMDYANQISVVQHISEILRLRVLDTLPLCVYVLGRMVDPVARRQAIETLEDLQKGNPEFAGWASIEPDRRFVGFCRRAIFISLAYLGDKQAAHLYVQEILSKPEAALLNRGFHRDYHGDMKTVPSEGLKHFNLEDRPEYPWDRTKEALEESLSRAEASNLTPRYIVELATYCSFIAFRLEAGAVSSENRLLCAQFLERFQGHIDGVPDFVRALRGALVEKTRIVGAAHVLRMLFRLKHEPRRGWVRMGMGSELGHATETVASHAYGMALLAHILLPDATDGEHGERFDKGRVIELILNHDIGESIVGDRTPPEIEQDPGAERKSIGWLSASGLFRFLGNSHRIMEDWNEFERGTTIEARIAKDLDALDPLLQVYIYRRHGDDIDELRKFIESYKSKIATPVIKKIFGDVEREAEKWIEFPLDTRPTRVVDP